MARKLSIVNDEEFIDEDETLPDFSWARSTARSAAVYPPVDRYLGDHHVYEGSRLTIEGATGDGKSMWGLGMSLSIVRKQEFLHLKNGTVEEPVAVLFMDYEMGRAELQSRLNDMGTHEDFYVICFDDPELGEGGLRPIDTKEGKRQLITAINATRARVVFIDNLYSAVEGSIVGGSGEGQAHEAVVPLLRELSKYNVATVLLAHTNSGGDLYGDKRLTWQLTGRMKITRIQPPKGKDDKVLRVKVEERKIRGKSGLVSPYIAVFEAGTWRIEQKAAVKTRNTVNETRLQLALACLALLEPAPDDTIPPDILDGVPRGRCVFGYEDLRELFYARLPDDSSAVKKKAFQRVTELMVNRRLVGRAGGFIWQLAE